MPSEFTPPSSTLKKMFCSKEFNTLLDRNIMYSDDIITDFRDGQIWREFSDANFFDCKYNIGLMLNDVENWPVKFKSPKKVHIRCKPELLRELNFFFGDLYENNLDYIQPRINKFGRCEVNGQKFSSDFNSTDRGSIVKVVMFVDRNGELTPYFGIVRFYYSVTIVVQQKPVTHYLAQVNAKNFFEIKM